MQDIIDQLEARLQELNLEADRIKRALAHLKSEKTDRPEPHNFLWCNTCKWGNLDNRCFWGGGNGSVYSSVSEWQRRNQVSMSGKREKHHIKESCPGHEERF